MAVMLCERELVSWASLMLSEIEVEGVELCND